MAENSAIEWTDHTFNPWSGCTKVSPGCANCYAERLSARGMTNGKGERTLGQWGPGAPRKRTSEANWRKPLTWNRKASESQRRARRAFEAFGSAGLTWPQRPRVFCASLADWLDPEVPAEWLADLLALVAATPHLDWLLLTKRPELWRGLLEAAVPPEAWCPCEGGGILVAQKCSEDRCGHRGDCPSWPCHVCMTHAWLDGQAPGNVWVGTSVEDQQRADERIPHLLKIPARVRFLSCEPLLGPVDLENVSPTEPGTAFRPLTGPNGPGIHWVIAGGESGPDARPVHPDWARSLRDQCQAAGVPFFFKQFGAWGLDGNDSYPTGHGRPSGSLEPWTVSSSTDRKSVGTTVYHATNDEGTRYERMVRVGKKKAGRELDGRTWDEVPA